MELGAQLLGLKFKNYLTLEAWRLRLAACGLQLGACTFFR
jgi:hypothetical protein